METHSVDMHANPVVFIQTICFIVGLDLKKMGFDPSITYEANGKNQCVEVSQVTLSSFAQAGRKGAAKLVTYRVTKLVSHTRSLRGPGTVVRDATELGAKTLTKVRIMDSWIHEGREKEVEIYQLAIEKGVKGMVPMKAAQQLDPKISTGALRRVLNVVFRQNNEQQFPNLVLSRVLVEGGYRNITHFKTRMQLLEVYRDSVQGTVRFLGLYSGIC